MSQTKRKNMDSVQVLSSNCGRFKIELLRDLDGFYSLQKIIRKYDDEEEKYYEVKELPNPSGKYQDPDVAIAEAKRILQSNTGT